jgi:CelD/BcsL family acetyltransferase involved in cellulose biosynthesis
MRIEVIHPGELDAGTIARWAQLHTAHPARSPYLTPDWARLVGAHRPDARVAIIEDGGETTGFIGVQRPSRFAALGLGAPIADYQGMVGHAPCAAGALCRALKVGRIDLAGALADDAMFAPYAAVTDGSWVAEVGQGLEAYRYAIAAQRPDFFSRLDRKHRRLVRERNTPVFTARSDDAGHFEQMLTWKRQQFVRTGQPRIWDTPWAGAVLRETFERRDEALEGILFTITTGGTLAAANYVLRSRGVLHGWIMAHNPSFEPYSPGVLLARAVIEWAAENGLDEVDFGPGDYLYKRQFATTQRAIGWGSIPGHSLSASLRALEYALRRRIERAPMPGLAELPGKAMRRMDLMRALAVPQ